MTTPRRIARVILALSFIWVGILHFATPDIFLAIMPPYLPWPLELVYVSGFFEILGGIGLVIPQTRRWATWGLLALLVAVYPANIHMLVNEVYLPDMPREKWILWARMPFQFVFAGAVLWTGQLKAQGDGTEAGVG